MFKMLFAVAALLAGTAAPHHRPYHHRHHHRSLSWSYAVASYYSGIGGACGIDAGREVYGVANKYLPCGTWLTICSARCARVQVVDRGPYVYGREYDVTENVARLIGFPMGAGVATIRVGR